MLPFLYFLKGTLNININFSFVLKRLPKGLGGGDIESLGDGSWAEEAYSWYSQEGNSAWILEEREMSSMDIFYLPLLD